MNKYTQKEEFIRDVSLPLKTRSYSPVAHGNIIDTVKEELDKKSLIISNENYHTDSLGQKLIGKYTISTPDKEIQRQILFRNSYDKSMSLGFVTGAVVMICSNGMIIGDTKIVRKHTGTVVSEIQDQIIKSIHSMDDEFTQIKKEKEQLKSVEIDDLVAAELLGKMFINESIITANQISAIKKELYFSEHFRSIKGETSLWNLYNNCTEVFKQSHPSKYISDHRNMHKYLTTV